MLSPRRNLSGRRIKSAGALGNTVQKVKNTFGNIVENIKSAPSRILDGIEARDKAEQDYKRQRNTRMIENVFGSVEKYNEFSRKQK